MDFDKMTDAQKTEYLDSPVTRSELMQVLSAWMQQEIEPLTDSRIMFLFSAVRSILDSQGILNSERFDSAFQMLTDEFTRKFGETPEDN